MNALAIGVEDVLGLVADIEGVGCGRLHAIGELERLDAGGQFCDRGQSYAPAIFASSSQKVAAEKSKQQVIDSGRVTGKVIVPILPLGDFWPAEDYHRDYAKRNKADYDAYREGCRRDQRLAQVWKPIG